MILKFKQTALLLLLFGCSTVEFIPEPEYTSYHSNYKKTSWEEVEVFRARPPKPFQIMGEIIIRNQGEQSWSELTNSLKKEMWERKMDGVWMIEKKNQKVDGFSLETMDNRGHTTSSYKDESNLPIWKGFAFRYK
ncbi:MAG: hypothetical protein SH817_14380 [Leptospira sp.]|nr:hypothetical protein [Leptospira sp.]